VTEIAISLGKKMNKIKLFLKKYWLFIILATITTILAIFYFSNKKTLVQKEKLAAIPVTKTDSYKTSATINYSLLEKNLENIENSGDVFQASNLFFSDKEIITLAQGLDFKDQPFVSRDQEKNTDVYNWDNEEKSLEVDFYLDQIVYHLKNYDYQLGKVSNLSFEEAEKFAYRFLSDNNLLPPQGIALEKEEISYVKYLENDFSEVKSSQEANLIRIELNYHLSQKKILNPSVIFLIDGNKQITDFIYQGSFKEILFLDKYPLKNKEEIKEKLKTIKSINYLYLLNSYGPEEDTSQNIKNIDLGKIELVYLKTNTPQSYLQPLFLITGQAVLNDGRAAEVGIYLPAIKDEYLLK
jgi:hypothetical protein